MKNTYQILIVLSFIGLLSVDILKPVKWTFTSTPTKPAVGQTVDLVFTGKIEKDWYIYSSELKVEGPNPTELDLISNGTYQKIGKLVAVNPKEKYDKIWEGTVHYFLKEAKFIQKVKILKIGASVEGKINSYTCTVKDGSCIPNKDKFSFKF
jgi:thiol:disulfide interchange protein DsbD